MYEDCEQSTSLADMPSHMDYTRLLKSYGYDDELVDVANNILYSQSHRIKLQDKTDKTDKMILEAIWQAHQTLGRVCDPHLIRIAIGKPSMRLKKKGDENIVIIRSCEEYVRLYLSYKFFTFVPEESREKMVTLAKELDNDDGLVELVTLQASAVVRHILDEDSISYKREGFAKFLGKSISAINSASQQLKTWLTARR